MQGLRFSRLLHCPEVLEEARSAGREDILCIQLFAALGPGSVPVQVYLHLPAQHGLDDGVSVMTDELVQRLHRLAVIGDSKEPLQHLFCTLCRLG